MPSSISSSDRFVSKAGFPWAFLTALLAFAACETFLWTWRPWVEFCARYAGPTVASDPLRTSARIRLLPRGGQPPILLIGSSQILEGLDCEVFEARFPGRTCRNLSIAGGTPLDVLFLMHQVDKRASRRTVITGVFPSTLHRGPRAAFSDTGTLACLFRSGDWLHLDATEWIDLLYGQMQDVSGTLRAKDSLRALWQVVGTDPRAALRQEIPPPLPRALDGRPPRTRAYLRQAMGVLDPSLDPRFGAVQEMALDDVIEGEARRGNRMVIIDFPTRRGYSTTITPDAVESHRQLVERLGSRPDVFLVRSTDLPPLSDDDFHDFTHLRASGRRKVSERIAEILLEIAG
jgi:hypothetical protein